MKKQNELLEQLFDESKIPVKKVSLSSSKNTSNSAVVTSKNTIKEKPISNEEKLEINNKSKENIIANVKKLDKKGKTNLNNNKTKKEKRIEDSKERTPFFKSNVFWILLSVFFLVLIFIVRYFVIEYTSVPKIELIGDSTLMLNLNDKYEEPGVKAILNEKDISNKVQIDGEVDTSKVGNYELTYSVTNDKKEHKRSVTRKVIIIDNVEPVITLKGSKEYFVGIGKDYKDPGFVAIDNVDGNITEKVKVDDSSVKTNTLGSYNVIYTVSDSSRNKTKVIRVVRVVDLTKPVLTLKGNTNIELRLSQKYVEPGYTATDNIDGNITNKVRVSGTVRNGVFGIYYLKYYVKDAYGNETYKTRTVKVGTQADQDKLTYINVSIAGQYLQFYKNGRLFISSNIVTGQLGKHDTPRGTYRIRYKTRNTYLTGEDYRSYVNYWMPVVGGIGLHDATWRSSFGGSIYKTNGSHGCVNLPLYTARTIYENAPTGTLVKIY